MDAEEERARQLLRAYGEQSAPSAEKRERAWAGIMAAAAAAPAASGTGNVLLKVVLGVGAVITIGLASWSWSGTADEVVPDAPPVSARVAPAARAAPPTVAAQLAPETVDGEVSTPESVRPSPAVAPSVRARIDGPTAATTDDVAPPAPSAGTLAEELAVMARAREAVARGDAPTAMAALDEHEARFPAGTLVREREVLRVGALCAAGRDDEAIAAAAAAGPRPAITRALSRCGAP